jgi:hypothetical protein
VFGLWPAASWQADSRVPGVDNPSVVSAAEHATATTFCGTAVCRELPDVSAQADQHIGAIIYSSVFAPLAGTGWVTVGGTSSSTPLWAAMLAEINATKACEAAGGLGFVAPKLYAVASNPAEYVASFNDITAGNNDDFGDAGGLFPATVGYDMATGLGSPRVTGSGGAPGLASNLCAASAAGTPVIASLTPSALPAGGGTVTITGSGFELGSTPDVAGVQVGSLDLPVRDYSVRSATKITDRVPRDVERRGWAARRRRR